MTIQRIEIKSEEFFNDLNKGNIGNLSRYTNLADYLNEVDKNGNNPLHIASKKGRVDIIQFLYDADKSAEKIAFKKALENTNNEGFTPLLLAVYDAQDKVVSDLLIKGANVNALMPDRSNGLHLVSKGSVPPLGSERMLSYKNILIALIDYGINYNAVDNDKNRVLNSAADPRICSWMDKYIQLKERLTTAKTSIESWSKAQTAAQNKLLELGKEANSAEESSISSVQSLPNQPSVSFLSSNQTSEEIGPVIADVKSFAAQFYNAINKGDLATLRSIQNIEDFLTIRDASDKTALHIACQSGNPEVVKFLCSKASPVILEAKYSVGYTPLMLAAMANHVEVVNILLEHKADACALTNGDFSVLHNAARSQSEKSIIKALIDAGADYQAVDGNNKKPADHLTAEAEDLKNFINNYGACTKKLNESERNVQSLKKEISKIEADMQEFKKPPVKHISQLGRGVYSQVTTREQTSAMTSQQQEDEENALAPT